MADGETIYSVRVAYSQYLDRGRAQTVRLPLHSGGQLAAPSAGTYSLVDPNGVELQGGPVTVVDKIATFALGALSATQGLGYGYREYWTLTMPDGVAHPFRRDAVVIRYPLYPTVTDEDLYAVHSDLRRQRPSTETSWETKRLEAWKRIVGRLEESGNLPNLILTPWSLRESHIDLSIYLIASDLRTGQGGKWETIANDHKREFELAWNRKNWQAWNRKNWQYETDDADPGADGTRESGEATLWPTLAPSSAPFGPDWGTP
jgi:hypothetical protein